ncbi:MAG: hypothetical protein KIH10_15335 [Candidatus Freyarchaeota archaeon]|nr:hypothetical protein [Candidatus Jordarchaeia archaeon]MBS7280862.1 hypothetical protein [Candidatus Jordarchaeia archaeon]
MGRRLCILKRRERRYCREDYGAEGLFKDSPVYTDAFTSYSGLSAAGYRHKTVSHSSGRVCLRVRLM